MSFNNLYYKRAVGTAKACYVCFKPTTTVLATANTVDFVYTCPNHLSDPNFAAKVDGENGTKAAAAAAAISAEEIAKVKAEWEQKQKAKKEKEKDEKKDEKKDDKDDKDKDSKHVDKVESPKSAPSASVSPPTHEKYILHRDFFSMRQDEHRRRRQAAQAKDLAPRLPSVPGTGLS